MTKETNKMNNVLKKSWDSIENFFDRFFLIFLVLFSFIVFSLFIYLMAPKNIEDTNLRLGQKVKVNAGFYEGCVGTVEDFFTSSGDYYVRFSCCPLNKNDSYKAKHLAEDNLEVIGKDVKESCVHD